MKNVKVVIGANFGDEGKGMITDYLAYPNREGTIVVRFNGSVQAGHTVVHGARRHVHGHFGSGTLIGSATYLSEQYVVHPMLFKKEVEKFESIPLVFVDPGCYVTTPYDMWINQLLEQSRGDKRHGSCGIGFGETIERTDKSKNLRVCLYAEDLSDLKDVKSTLNRIRHEWVPQRLEQLQIKEYDESFLGNDAIVDNYIKDVELFNNCTHIRDLDVLKTREHIIFEGAQGLMLDQDWGYFPHVTRSNTGLKNVVSLLNQIGHDTKGNPLEVVYVTRTYTTRHGAGPFAHEVTFRPYSKIEDLTNFRNTWQGDFRFGYLCLDQLQKSIEHDLEYANGLETKTTLAVTCLDQLDDAVWFISNGKMHRESPHAFMTVLECMFYPERIYTGNGPSRETVAVRDCTP